MTVFNRGDVVLVAFPFTDLTSSKMRPALVVSTHAFHSAGIDVILAAITSQIPGSIPELDHLLSTADQRLAGLPKQSMVRPGKIVTIDRRLIRKKLGRLPDETMQTISLILGRILAGQDDRGAGYSCDRPSHRASESRTAYNVHRRKRRAKRR